MYMCNCAVVSTSCTRQYGIKGGVGGVVAELAGWIKTLLRSLSVMLLLKEYNNKK